MRTLLYKILISNLLPYVGLILQVTECAMILRKEVLSAKRNPLPSHLPTMDIEKGEVEIPELSSYQGQILKNNLNHLFEKTDKLQLFLRIVY